MKHNKIFTRHVTNLSVCMLVTFETPCFLKKNKRLFKDELFFSGVWEVVLVVIVSLEKV